MAQTLRALIVDDLEEDAMLVIRELKRSGFELDSIRVDTPELFVAALAKQPWDIILCDYAMPRFSAPAALALAKQSGIELPFIIVSGTIGEETAVDALKLGADDYLLKDKLHRLGPSIQRALREVSARIEARKMRDQLVMSDRMVCVGTLAAGVAHEINNPLTAVLANMEFLALGFERLTESLRADAPIDRPALVERCTELTAALQDAREAAERVRDISGDLKVFSRPEAKESDLIEVERVLESSLRMAWTEIRHRAALIKDFTKVPRVMANETRLGQVFLNLLVNAAHAIGDGRATNNQIRLVTKLQGAKVIIEVHDTGEGIAKENLSKIFDPFFTTKPVGVGTGLGLAICQGIVTGLGGTLTVESEVGKGTMFRVSLPVAKESEIFKVPKAQQLIASATRRARIWVVDDEAAIGMAIKRSLPTHDVLYLQSGREVLKLVEMGESCDLVFCDLMMPEMSGMQLHDALSARHSGYEQKMVFMTGGAFTPIAREFLGKVPNARLDKPFNVQSLTHVIGELLHA